jgi:hypothetical protein
MFPRSGEPRRLTRVQFERLCQALPKHPELAACFALFSMLRMRSRLMSVRADLFPHSWVVLLAPCDRQERAALAFQVYP